MLSLKERFEGALAAVETWPTEKKRALLAEIEHLPTVKEAVSLLGCCAAPAPAPAPRPATPPEPKWPSFPRAAAFVGENPIGRVAVWYDASLGNEALANARWLLSDADRIVKENDGFFGKEGGKVNVVLFAIDGKTDGTGGADHMGCTYRPDLGGNIEVCVAYGHNMRVSALFEAELSECNMGGNLCGVSTGEALSRWCAALVSNNALSDFATATAWAKAGMPNWVDQTFLGDASTPGDGNPVATGCGMAFLSWLLSQKVGFAGIAQRMVKLGSHGTLASLYAAWFPNSSRAWPAFKAAIEALPAVKSDDPFGAVFPQDAPRSHRLMLGV